MPQETAYPTVRIADFPAHEGAIVTVKGWLYHKSGKGKLQFLRLRDGSGICQAVVFQPQVPEEVFTAAKRLTQESSLTATGQVCQDARSPDNFELRVTDLQIVQLVEGEYPLQPKEHGIDFLLAHRHLWLRSRKQVATLKIRAEVVRAIREFFDSRGFVLVDAPIFTPAACEGTSTLFECRYFDWGSAYLTQSGQLYMEAAAMALGRVYCFGPTFRAERSKTRRHLTEFWMVEPEMAYAGLDELLELAEQLVSFVVQRCLQNRAPELRELERDTSKLEPVKPPFPRLSYDEAVELLRQKGLEFQWGDDFGAPHETALSENFDRPVCVHRYPAQAKAFYMKRDPQDDRLALCVDVIAPEGAGEIIGGGQRADSLSYLEQQIERHHLPREAFEWYLDLRRYGSVPHGGFGLGLERTVAWICGTDHVRETIPFPRMLYRIYP